MVHLLIASNYEEIFNKLDFTDSFIEEIKWENTLFDLVLVVDYFYEDYKSKLLKITFSDCMESNFLQTRNLLEIPDKEKHSYSISWHTIQFYEKVTKSEQLKKYNDSSLNHYRIFTADLLNPWLSVICRGIEVQTI